MTCVYVVTVSGPEGRVGEFHKAEAYPSYFVARAMAGECMEESGGRDRFVEDEVGTTIDGAGAVVKQQWVGPRCSVWIERLELVR